MKFFEKIKLLFKIKKPASDLIDQVKDAKRGWKTVAFWVSLLGTLGALVSALTGVVPAMPALIASTVLVSFYNVLRGAQKAEETGVHGVFTTTEFWLSAGTELLKGLVVLKEGGINPAWFSALTTIVGAAMAAGQNLAARSPVAPITQPSVPSASPAPGDVSA